MLIRTRSSDVEYVADLDESASNNIADSRRVEDRSVRQQVTERIDLFFKKSVLQLLAGLQGGVLEIVDEQGRVHRFGAGPNQTKACADSGCLTATVTFHDVSVWRDIALRGSIGAAEAFVEGRWSTQDLVGVIRIMARNTSLTDKMEKGFARLFTLYAKIDHSSRRNTRSGARKNIYAHYDLGNEFFKLFLDKEMMYSSAVFPSADASLEQASEFKLQRICRKLDLGLSNHLLEIGSGWGGLAIHAAKNYGCKVTTVTISRRQHEYVQRKIDENGLRDLITVELKDYRKLEGSYDRLVSIEMIEAVGHEYLSQYFDICQRLLSKDGRMLLQGITVPDDRYHVSRRGVDFIQKYIFPGGGLPSTGIILDCIARQGKLRMIHFEDLAGHYAKTLAVWRAAFLANRERIIALGFSQEFIRLWDYYFAYCEGGFSERSIGLTQILFVGEAVSSDQVDVVPLPAVIDNA